ncbi:TPA: autotransporter outer membrane beta-barrel domain-containing protein [Citrobacter freundii]
MNRNYNIVWNAARNMYMVTAEFVHSGGVHRQVRIAALALGALLSASAYSNPYNDSIGPQSGASITIDDNANIESYDGTTGIDSTTAGGTGVQINGGAVISVQGGSGSLIGVHLDNGTNNDLGSGSSIIVDNTSTESPGNITGLLVGNQQANTSITADHLQITINPTNSGQNAYGVYLKDGSGDFSMDGGSVRVGAPGYGIAQNQTVGIDSPGDASVNLGSGTDVLAYGNMNVTGISIGNSGSLTADSDLYITVNALGGMLEDGIVLDNNSHADIGTGGGLYAGGSSGLVQGITVNSGSSFTADNFYTTLETTSTDSPTGRGILLDGGRASADLGYDSTIELSGFYYGAGIDMMEGSGTFSADYLTIDASGKWVYGIQQDGGSMDLGVGSTVSATGEAETIWVTGGDFTARGLTVNTAQSTGINAQGGTADDVVVNIGGNSVVDGRNVAAGGSTNGISATYAGFGSSTATLNFNGTAVNRNEIYAVNGYGASAQFSGQTINISNTDITMSGDGKSLGLWAVGDDDLTSGGVINGENLNIDMTDTGADSVGVMVQQGGVINLAGNTTIITDGGVAIRNAKTTEDNGATLVPGGTITGSGKMTIEGDIVSDGWGSIDLTMSAGSDFTGATSVNHDIADMDPDAYSTLNLTLANKALWTVTDDSSLTNLTSDGKVVLASDMQNGTYSTLDADTLTLQDDSELDVDYAAATQASHDGTPLITGGVTTLDGDLKVSDSAVSDLSDLTSDQQFAQGKIVLIDADSPINGNFSSLSMNSASQPDYLAFSGQINPNDDTQYLLGAGLSWYADSASTVSTTAAHGTFTLDAGKSFEVTSALVDVAPDVTTGWDGRTLTKKGGGTLILDAVNTYSGATNVEQGALWLDPNAVIGVAGSQQLVDVAQGAAFGGDNATVNGNVENSGSLYFDNTLTVNGDVTNSGALVSGSDTIPLPVTQLTDSGQPDNTLVINGDYTGNGGSLTLNTYLGDDSSPTDKLVVNGNTSGDTTLYINQSGGEGAQTTDGIEVVQVNGTSDGVFTQGNQVQAGLYEYRLYQDDSNGDWYLRSQSSSPTPPEPDDDGDTPVTPQYRADIGAYLGNQWMARSLQMQTLYDREGSQYHNDDGSVWARFRAGSAASQAASGNVDIDNNYSQFQLGGDILTWKGEEQSLTVGLMGSYINADTDSTGNRGADGSQFSASGNVDGYNLGVYATWFADAQNHSGMYVDSWYQYGTFNNSVDDGDVGSEDYDSTANGVSLETGYRYDITLSNNNAVSLTPQAQVTWQNYQADSVTDNSGTRIDGQNGDSWTSRLGLRVDGKLHKNQNSVIQPFMEANWLHTSDDTSVSFDSDDVKQDIPTNRAELKAGIQANINSQWSVTAQVAGQKGSNDYGDLNGSLNLRYNW